MSDDRPDASLQGDVAAVRAGLGSRNPKLASTADVEASLLRLNGLGDLSDRLWLESAAVSAEARKSVRRHVRARFGARSPRTGPLTVVVFLLLLATTAPLALLNSLRQGASGVEPAAAVVAAAIGVAILAVIALAGGNPLSRPTVLQTGGAAVLLGIAGAIGATVSDGWVRILFIAGPVAAVLALVLLLVVRARDREATEQIDNALEIAHLDVAPEVRAARDRMLRDLQTQVAGRPDLAALRRVRSATIADLNSLGNPITDDDPSALPGACIIDVQTNAWMPSAIAHARPSGLGG